MIALLAAGTLAVYGAVQAERFDLGAPGATAFFADADGDGRPELCVATSETIAVTWLDTSPVTRALDLPAGLWAVDPGPGPAERSQEPGVYWLRANRLEWVSLEPASEAGEAVEVVRLEAALPLAQSAPAPFPLRRQTPEGVTFLVPTPRGIDRYRADGTREETPDNAAGVQWLTTRFQPGLRAETWPTRSGVNVALRYDFDTETTAARIPPRWGTPEQWRAAPADAPERWPWFYLSRDPASAARAYFRVTGASEPRTIVRVQPGGPASTEPPGLAQEYPGYPMAAPDYPGPDVDGDGDTELFLWRGKRALAPGSAAARIWREGVWTVYLEMRDYDTGRRRFGGSPAWRAREEVPMRWLLHAERTGPVRHLAMPDWNGDRRTDLGYAVSPTEYVTWTASEADDTLADRTAFVFDAPLVRIAASATLEGGATMLLLLTETEAVVVRQAAPGL